MAKKLLGWILAAAWLASCAAEAPRGPGDASMGKEPQPREVRSGWSVSQGKILFEAKAGEPQEVVLKGLNWFGMETPDIAPHGLWEGRSIADFLKQIKGLGFNALRLPLSPLVLREGAATASWAQQEAKDGPGMLQAMLAQTKAAGIYVVLDFHTYDPEKIGVDLPGQPFGDGYSKADWLRDLERLAELSLAHPHVVGIDLCNEPHGLTWVQWEALVREAGQLILRRHPGLLLLVEGVGDLGGNGGFPVNWGGNLSAAGAIDGLPAHKLLFSPHTYGPDVYEFPYFKDAAFPANMPAIWDRHFGHLRDGGFALMPGEFGGRYKAGSLDETWQNAYVKYLRQKQIRSFFYWALNPNSGDTGGVLLDDWKTPDPRKLRLLQELLRES